MNATARATALEGSIARTLLSLAWPVLVVLALQTFVGIAETWFVSFLGTDALAGVALVFPLFMLMTMMSNGGIGGGVSSAVARALGAGRTKDAEALAMHAVVIGLVLGVLFAIGAWLGGPTLFRRMGAQGETLSSAVLYSNVLFLAAVPGWIANLLAAVLRGAGNVRVPAIVTATGALVTLMLSPLFIFGWGWVPRMGVAGAGVALILFNVGSAVVLVLYMRSAHSAIRLARNRLQWRLFNDILKVGLVSAIGTVVANLTVVVTTGLVGAHGRDAIAGYGLASRLGNARRENCMDGGSVLNFGYCRHRTCRRDLSRRMAPPLQQRCPSCQIRIRIPHASGAFLCAVRGRHVALLREPGRRENGVALCSRHGAPLHSGDRWQLLDTRTGRVAERAVLDCGGRISCFRRDQCIRARKRSRLEAASGSAGQTPSSSALVRGR